MSEKVEKNLKGKHLSFTFEPSNESDKKGKYDFQLNSRGFTKRELKEIGGQIFNTLLKDNNKGAVKKSGKTKKQTKS